MTEATSPFPMPQPDADLLHRVARIAQSYQRLLGKPLVQSDDSAIGLWSALWHAPRVIVAHGTQDDPIFFYGNRLALERFDMPWEEFTRLPSRYSAEAPQRDERTRLLERVSRDGYIDDYAGVRIAKGGARFRIEAATVWNLVDADGAIHGQAATFAHWTEL